DNCLKPIELSTVPYAVKSEFSLQSQMAQNAQIAAQCHYAHRATADVDLYTSEAGLSGKGYFDFHSPTADVQVASTFFGASVNQDQGFLQWRTERDENTLNLCARDVDGHIVNLEALYLHANDVKAAGSVEAEQFYVTNPAGRIENAGHFHQNGAATFDSTATFQGSTTLSANVNFNGGSSPTDRSVITFGDFTHVEFNGTVDLPDTVELGSGDIAQDAVNSYHIDDGSITSDDIANETITSSDIDNGTITAADLASDSVNYSEIATGAVRSGEIFDGTIQARDIKDHVVGEGELDYSTQTVGFTNNYSARWLPESYLCLLVDIRCKDGSSRCGCYQGTSSSEKRVNNGIPEIMYKRENAECRWKCFR
ncbi:MAG: hypothetical protein MK135_15175, partial [Polyangiaceae bacterium]|nr:hypothetical protein [Polyangiaceae bacterium]